MTDKIFTKELWFNGSDWQGNYNLFIRKKKTILKTLQLIKD